MSDFLGEPPFEDPSPAEFARRAEWIDGLIWRIWSERTPTAHFETPRAFERN